MIDLSNAYGALCGSSVLGAAHRRVGKINQDACLGDVFGDWSLIAVADGHGSEPHFRSDRGSRLAVEAARSVMRDWVANASDHENESTISELPRLISAQWRAYVDADLRLDPIAPTKHDLRFLPYGSTLAAAALTNTKALFLQIGDGDILLDDGGGILSRPLPAAVGLVGEQTYSLCLPDPIPYFRVALHALQTVPVSRPFVVASTDGLHKSYSTEPNFLKAVQNWREIVAVHGTRPAVTGLDNWLTCVTEQGNGDDISMMLYAAN